MEKAMCLLVTDLIILLISGVSCFAAVGAFHKDFPFVGPPAEDREGN